MDDAEDFPKLRRLVAVAWLDSGLHGSWRDLEEVRRTLTDRGSCVHVRSVGWVLHEDETMLCLVASQSSSDEVAGGMEIPKVCIASVVALGPLTPERRDT